MFIHVLMKTRVNEIYFPEFIKLEKSIKFLSVKLELFSYPLILINVWDAQNNHLIETFLLITHNVCFGSEIWKNSRDKRFQTMWYVRPAKAQTSLRVSDQSICWLLEYFMNIKLLTEHHLEFLSLKGGNTGSSESTLVKMSHCWKSHVTSQFSITRSCLEAWKNLLFSEI